MQTNDMRSRLCEIASAADSGTRRFILALIFAALAASGWSSGAFATERSPIVDLLTLPALSSKAASGQILSDPAPPNTQTDPAEDQDLNGSLGVSTDPQAVPMSTFKFYNRNMTSRTIYFKFFSQNRPWVWPGANTAWVAPPDHKQRYVTLSCQRGEKVCFGGWWPSNPNVYWGVGPQGNRSCSNCCYICNGGQAAVRFVR